MKYRQLTKEQLEPLHYEFAKFLAVQQIDAKEWQQIKREKPQVAEEEMAIFSDMVWEDVLTKTRFLEHFSSSTINLFQCDETQIHRIVITVHKKVDLLQDTDYNWLLDNFKSPAVEFFTGTKKYALERNVEIFDLIEKGSVITDGKLYQYINNLLKK